VLHGLRKTAACALIDIGCTPHQVASITGHKSTRMIEEYVRDRDRARLGKAAMTKWGKSKRREQTT
jgi:integrase